jgi:hypothetical protein
VIAADRLIGKAHDYEVLAASHSERKALVVGGYHLAAATAFAVAAIVMREVAAALEDEWEAALSVRGELARRSRSPRTVSSSICSPMIR